MGIQYRVPHPPEFTVEDVRKHLRKFSVADGLRLINRLSRRLYFDTATPGMVGMEMGEGYTLAEWDLAFIAKELILWSNDHRSGQLSKDRGAFGRTMFLVSNMSDPVLGSDRGVANKQGLYSLVRFANQQFKHQGGWWHDTLFRTYLLYEKTWRRLPDVFDLEQSSLEVFGMPLPTFLALGTALCGLAADGRYEAFSQGAISNTNGDPRLEVLRRLVTEDALQNLWPRVATDYAGFRKLWEARREKDLAYARFEFNPLEERPVVLTQRPVWCIVPSVSSLVLRFSDGIYHDFFNHYLQLGSHEKFTIPFGEVFQEYVGWQLRAHCGDGAVIPEKQYRIGRDEWRGPDWILVEGDRAILIECKAARLPLSGKVTANEHAIEDGVRKKLVPAIAKFPEKIRHIRDLPDVYPELRTVTRFYPVVVTLDPWWPPDPFHRVIDEELTRQGVICDPYHVLSIDTLEKLMPLAAAGVRVSDVLQERIDGGQQSYGFGEELSAKCRKIGHVAPNKLLHEARREFFGAILPP